MRDNDVPQRVVSHVVDALEKVINRPYDQGDAADRAETRREYILVANTYSGMTTTSRSN
jgi:hypothetical protein